MSQVAAALQGEESMSRWTGPQTGRFPIFPTQSHSNEILIRTETRETRGKLGDGETRKPGTDGTFPDIPDTIPFERDTNKYH
jgi:hypothetical protein